MRIIDLRGREYDPATAITRTEAESDEVAALVEPILAAVKGGDTETLLDYSARFDGVRPEALRVPADVLRRTLEELDPEIKRAIEVSVRQVRAVHQTQTRERTTAEMIGGSTVTMKWLPVRRVGLYVPGGQAVYPSSVVMNVVPAQIAGVASIAIASPPQASFDGWPHPTILATAAMLGIEEVYAVGGAQAVAMFAYGARAGDGEIVCRPVDMVTGPGNIFVATAKRLLKGVVGIDSEAGPTEIAILADDSARAEWVAADLISQAEHDPLAVSVLVTTSQTLAEEVRTEVEDQTARTHHRERVQAALQGPQSGIYVVDDLEAGVELVNHYGAEHLEIHTSDAASVAERITSAGAVFVGPYSPVSLGDYCAGSNHVLPTGGGSRFSSGLSVQTFLRGVQFIEYTREGLESVRDAVRTLSNAEGLPAHGDAVDIRAAATPGAAVSARD